MLGSNDSKQFENVIKSILMLGIALYVINFFALPRSKQNTIFYATVLLPWLMLLPYYIKDILPRNFSSYLILFCVFYISVSSLWSSDPGDSLGSSLKYSIYILCFLSAVYWVNKSKTKIFIPLILLGLVSFGFIIGLYSVFESWPINLEVRFTHYRFFQGDDYPNPLSTGMYFGIAALVALHYYRTVKNKFSVVGFITLFLFFIGIIILTKSRGPLIFLVPSILLMLWFIRPERKNRDIIFIVLMLVISSVVITFYYEQLFTRFDNRDVRIDIWGSAFKEIASNIMFGRGLNYDDVTMTESGLIFSTSHNFVIQHLLVGGLVSAVTFVGLSIYAVVIGVSGKPINKLMAIWFLYGCMCLCTNGKLLVYRPSSLWFGYWIPLFLILCGHVNSLDSSKNKHFSALSGYLRWQKGYSRIRWQLNVISGLWMSSFAWIVSKTEDKIKTEPCDVLVLYRRKNARQDTRLVELLSEKHRVKSAFQVKRPKMIKQRLLAKVPWLVPASLYIQASYAQFLVYKYQPKIIITSANGSALSPFLRAAMNDSAGSIVHIAHSVPTENHRGFSLIDVDYYFVYGKSSIDKLQQRQHLFGTAKCIETGSWVINELDTEMTLNENKMEKAVLLLGSGPKVELRDSTEKIYKLVIAWVLDHPEFKLYFKPHPRSDCGLWNRLIVDIDANKFEKIDNLSSNVAHCYAAIAPYTNAVLDVSLLGIPPLWISTKDDDDEFSYEDFFGMRTDNEQQLSEKLTDYIDRPDFYKEQTKLFVNYHIHHPQQGVAEFMAETIEQIMIGKGELLDGEIVSESQMK